jgi:hypothetical protein
LDLDADYDVKINGICVQHGAGHLPTGIPLRDECATEMAIKKVMVLLKIHVHGYSFKFTYKDMDLRTNISTLRNLYLKIVEARF